MKAKDFDQALLKSHRAYLLDESAAAAFDRLVARAVTAGNISCRPKWHGEVRDFRYEDPATGEWPFAFIVNRRDLLFYVRRAGFKRLPGGFAAFQTGFPAATQNPRGEWMLRIRTVEEAEALSNRLFGTAGGDVRGTPWTGEEVQAVVADYVQMLKLELNQQSFSKTAHRRALLSRLNGRTEASIELKHQNISAILVELGAPWITGYKPRRNYQTALFDLVSSWLQKDPTLDDIAGNAVERPAISPALVDYANLIVDAPVAREARDTKAGPYKRPECGVRRDYLGLEARNRSLGLAGEELVVAYERHRLHEVGAHSLVDRVEHVAKTRGDGLGYDILSFDANGKERLIEVKTTAFGREAPFYVTQTELALSKEQPEHFRLCRLFEFRRQPKMFELAGSIASQCHLNPVSYLATFS